MKRAKKLMTLIALLLAAFMLTGCLSVDMKINKNGSMDLAYIIDLSVTQGLLARSDIEEAIKESVDDMNDKAGKEIAKLKSVKENKGKKTLTATIHVSDINKMGDGTFFGTVKNYHKGNGTGLDNLVDSKGKSIDQKKINDKLNMFYIPMGGTEQYGLFTVTVTAPGSIKYISSGGDIEKSNKAAFNGQDILVVYSKGGGFPFWLVIIAALVVLFFVFKKKKPASSPDISSFSPAPVGGTPVQTPPQSLEAEPVDAPTPAPVAAPIEPTVDASFVPSVEEPAETGDEATEAVDEAPAEETQETDTSAES